MSKDLICGNLPPMSVEQSKKAAEFADEIVKRSGKSEDWESAYCLSGATQPVNEGFQKLAEKVEKINAEQTSAALDAFSQKAPTATALVRELGKVTGNVVNQLGSRLKIFGPSARSAMTPKPPPLAQQDVADALELTTRELKNGKIHSLNEFVNDFDRNLVQTRVNREVGNAFKNFHLEPIRLPHLQEIKK